MSKAAQTEIDAGEVALEASPPAKASRLKLILIASLALLLLGASGGALWYFMGDSEASDEEAAVADTSKSKAASKGKDKKADKDKSQDRKPSVFMNLEIFTVNLQSDGGDRVLQTTIVFELSDEKAVEAVKAQMPVIRSKLLLLLSAKNAAELNTPGGKEKLAVEIADEARKYLASKPAEKALLDVHFNTFVIQ